MTSAAAELMAELEWEGESEFEHGRGPVGRRPSDSADSFFNPLAAMADRGGRSQALRRVALAAAREALRGASRPIPAIEGEFESAHEFELELEFSPARRDQLAARMEHLAHAASEAESEQEAAEQFLPLIPLAAKFALPLLGKVAPFAAKGLAKAAPKILGRIVPQLSKGIGRLAGSLFRSRTTKPLLRVLPKIARSTMMALGKRMAKGRPISPQMAARVLAQQTARTLASPRALVQGYRQHKVQDSRYHQHHGNQSSYSASLSDDSGSEDFCPTCGQSVA